MALAEAKPDIYELFSHYNSIYFEDALGACILSWTSRRMNSSAGACCFQNDGSCKIVLSKPLLNSRSTDDLKNTLLHQMIHGFLFAKLNNRNNSDHGPSFLDMMNHINNSKIHDYQRPPNGYKITIHHDFDGDACKKKCKFCGDFVKECPNSQPSTSVENEDVIYGSSCRSSSCQWHRHMSVCSGRLQMPTEQPGIRSNMSRSKVSAGPSSKKQKFQDKIDEDIQNPHTEEMQPMKKKQRILGFDLPKKERSLITRKRRFDKLLASGPANDDGIFSPPISKKNSAEMHPMGEKERSDSASRKERTCVSAKRREKGATDCGKPKEIAVYSAWLNCIEYVETDEEEVEPLINRRLERRKKMNLLRASQLRSRGVDSPSP